MRLTEDDVEGATTDPHFLPDGRHFLFSQRGGEEAGIYLASLDDPEGRRILREPSAAVYAPSPAGGRDGHILFERGGSLFAQPFDAASLALQGDPFQVTRDRVAPMTHFAMSTTAARGGLITYLAGSRRDLDSRLVWVDRTGTVTEVVGPPGRYSPVSLSPDGRQASVVRGSGLWLRNLDLGEEDPVGFGEGVSIWSNGIWSPDGSRVAYVTAVVGDGGGPVFEIRVGSAVNPGQSAAVYRGPTRRLPSDWTRDGTLVYTEDHPDSGTDLWYVQVGPDGNHSGEPEAIRRDDFNTSFGDVSPDGRLIAYVSDETGEFQVWVQPFPTGPGRWRVSRSGAHAMQPRWGPDGRELFFVHDATGAFMAAQLDDSADPGSSPLLPPRELFRLRINSINPQRAALFYDISPDGDRFLIDAIPDYQQPVLHVLSNWEAIAEGQR